jgi:hypothetical protein
LQRRRRAETGENRRGNGRFVLRSAAWRWWKYVRDKFWLVEKLVRQQPRLQVRSLDRIIRSGFRKQKMPVLTKKFRIGRAVSRGE